MTEDPRGFVIELDRCDGRLACMRACPTDAIRVIEGKAMVLPEMCIDCGECTKVCPTKAIRVTTRSFDEIIQKYRFKVAVPTPALFSQFPMGITPAHIVAGLHEMGFDAVWDFAVELEMVNQAVVRLVEQWPGARPLISVSCPAIVRLVQVLYPGMVDQLVEIQTPRELAGRAIKRRYSQELGLDPDDIAAIYITPCQAKTISILRPAEGTQSNLEGAVGISDIYNRIVALTREADDEQVQKGERGYFSSAEMLCWATREAQGPYLGRHHYMSVTGLDNVIQVFDDVEKGKLRNIDYLECYTCWEGCLSGNLTVDNMYVTRSKIQHLLSEAAPWNPILREEVERRISEECLSMGKVLPRNVDNAPKDLKERVRQIKAEEQLASRLPGLNCGLCGAPSCQAFANDVAHGHIEQHDCVFLSDERIKHLRELYPQNKQDNSGPA